MPQAFRNTVEILSGGYSYSFNGMETDHEVSGHGNSYTTQFRQYDPRLGRWKSLDPLMAIYPSMSPFVAFNDNPVYFTDPHGLEGEPNAKNETSAPSPVVKVITVKGIDLYTVTIFDESGYVKQVYVREAASMQEKPDGTFKIKSDIYSANIYPNQSSNNGVTALFKRNSAQVGDSHNTDLEDYLNTPIELMYNKDGSPYLGEKKDLMGSDGTAITYGDVLEELNNQDVIEVVVIGNENIQEKVKEAGGDPQHIENMPVTFNEDGTKSPFTEDTDGDGESGTWQDFTLKRAEQMAKEFFDDWKNVTTISAYDPEKNTYQEFDKSTVPGKSSSGGTVIYKQKKQSRASLD